MPNYLTKEEIRQWRSSLEKITLEEFAARLGKEVEEKKPTNDLVDIVMTKGTSSTTDTKVNDGFSKIAERAFERERQISHTPFSIGRNQLKEKKNINVKNDSERNTVKNKNKELKRKEVLPSETKDLNKDIPMLEKVDGASSQKEVHIMLKKVLTDREQLVFDYLMNNIGKTVYAKDLANLLELPRDYVYKYIKNLRAKIVGDKLKNVPSGGFVLAE